MLHKLYGLHTCRQENGLTIPAKGDRFCLRQQASDKTLLILAYLKPHWFAYDLWKTLLGVEMGLAVSGDPTAKQLFPLSQVAYRSINPPT